MPNKPLAVEVNQQFQRSVRVDADFERADSLNGYVPQPSPRQALDIVARHINETQQRAFTWTGPYGGGKSSLALALAHLAGGTPNSRKIAKQALRVEPGDAIYTAFGRGKPWLVLPVVGRREAVEDAIGEAIDRMAPLRGRKPEKNGRRNVVAELVRRAENGEYGGVLLILDELGKLLEAAAAAGEDIYFYQELAEAASRTNGRLVVVGILHQAFDQYVARSRRDVQNEWAKVQGRFVDIPIVAGTDEVIELIGGALSCARPHVKSKVVASVIATAIHRRRPSSPPTLADSLDRCWPLHPVTAALLGPSSRRKFGQNERSVFGFLSAADPLGFREFLQEYRDADPLPYYSPARYLDYLRTNFESAILASPDGHRWAVCADAVERAEARFQEPHVSLVKATGLIELFRNGSGVAADVDVLVTCVEGFSRKQIESALDELAKASVLVYRKHLQAWGVFAGSDFDIEAAVAQARQATDGSTEEQLRALAMLPPLSARRHYSETGTLRWFEREVMLAETARSKKGKRLGPIVGTGCFALLLPSSDCSEEEARKLAKALSMDNASSLRLYGVPKGQLDLVEQAAELAALSHVADTHPALEGDTVAKREIGARLRHLKGELESALRGAFGNAHWYFDGESRNVKQTEGLAPLASEICDLVFHEAPQVHSELVNRDSLSSNSAKAQRMLLHRMITFGHLPSLGYEGYPADAGLYYTTLVELGLHQARDGQGVFVSPDKVLRHAGAKTLRPLWEAIRKFLRSAPGQVSLEQIYEVARQPPFGVKEGLLPILALAFLLTNRSEIALYVEDAFIPDLGEAGVDEWMQDPQRVAWKWVHMDTTTKQLLTKLATQLEITTGRPVAADPLDSARALVSIAMGLPAWVQRTQRVGAEARSVRSALLRATDPVKVIFVDLPELLGTDHDPDKLVSALAKVIDELRSAYPTALSNIRERMLAAIDHSGDVASLRSRAKVVQGISGDFKLDAFAGRLQLITDSEADIEGLVSLATSKPPKEFNDHDLDLATVQLAKWAFEFRRVEALAGLQGRVANRRALAVIFGNGTTVSRTFDVAEADGEAISKLADGMLDRLTGEGIRADVFLAALAEAGARALALQGEETV